VRVAEPIALTSILPYAWKLVSNFDVTSESNAPFYAGCLIAAFSLSEACSGLLWGSVSDRVGRKPVVSLVHQVEIVARADVGILQRLYWAA
jgi:MFS family permease